MLEILLVFLLIGINGIFSATEMALLDVREYELGSDKKALKIKSILKDPSKFLSTIQIMITLVGFIASAFAAEHFAEIIVQNINLPFLSDDLLKTISVFVITLLLSYFTLVFGELVPKQIALSYPKAIARFMVNPLLFLTKVFYPFVWILTISSKFILRILGIKKEKKELDEMTIKRILMDATKMGAIEGKEKELIFNVFDLNDRKVKDIMTPLDQVTFLDIHANKRDTIKIMRDSKYSKFPVYETNKENIIGILNVKNILLHYQKKEEFEIQKFLFEPHFVDESDIIDDVFAYMKNNTLSMAVVKKEGRAVGIVTMEDLVEEVMGNIYDEYDRMSNRVQN